jgi:hypothetical protein
MGAGGLRTPATGNEIKAAIRLANRPVWSLTNQSQDVSYVKGIYSI